MILLTRAFGIALLAAGGLATARLSTSEVRVGRHERARAVLRLSMGARPERIEICREQSNEELAKVLPQMRLRVVCEGVTARYRLVITRDGAPVLTRQVRGGGLRHDRQLYAFHEVAIPPGPSRIGVRLERVDTVPATRRDDDERVGPDRRGAGEGERHQPQELVNPDRERREREERGRRRAEAVPASLRLDTAVVLTAGDVLLVTYSPEERRLRFVTRESARRD